MKYFSEEERLKKERWLQTYPTFIQSIYNKMVGAHDCYYEELSPLINEKTVLLDAGCGKKGIMQLFKGRNAMTVGIDMQIDAIKRNAAMDYKVISNVKNIPFWDETFHVIISQWLIEHIPNPETIFNEFRRILKTNGSLILVTNSIYNPLMMFSAVMPQGLRDRLKNRLLPPEIEEDTFPTYYMCNSVGKMDRMLRNLKYEKKLIAYLGDPSFFIFSKIFFPITLFYELLTAVKFLRPFKMHIVAHYIKK